MRLSQAIACISLIALGAQAAPSAAQGSKENGCYVAIAKNSHSYPPFENTLRLPDSKFNSQGQCLDKCNTASKKNKVQYKYAAVHERSCYCGTSLADNAKKVKAKQCNIPCPGYPAEKCGGYSRVTVFELDD